VIECSWKVLLDFLNKKEGDLDAMIEAHRSYLDRVVKKVLLLSPKSGKQVRRAVDYRLVSKSLVRKLSLIR
jgi:hypothetical protein